MRLLRFLPVVILLLDACIDPLAVKLPMEDSTLVIDGMITDSPGPYQVKLFYSNSLESKLGQPKTESGASVTITDDLGQSELLTDKGNGVYESNALGIRGQIGRSYYVNIITKEGLEIRSAPQLLLSAGEMTNVQVVFEENGLLINKLKISDAFSVFVDAHGTVGAPNLFHWRWTGTHKVKTNPEFHFLLTKQGPIPDPLPCSGYIYNNGSLQQVRPCTCCICWTTEFSNGALVSDNNNINALDFHKVEVARLEANEFRFYEKYYMEVEQFSVSAEVYEFWRLVDAQRKATGSLFQPNSVRVRGNLSCISNPAKNIFGIFAVSGVVKKSFFVYKDDIPFALKPGPRFGEACLDVLDDTGTETQPPFW